MRIPTVTEMTKVMDKMEKTLRSKFIEVARMTTNETAMAMARIQNKKKHG